MADKQEEYEITASNGHVYRINGTSQQAKDLGDWIESKIAAGDPDLADATGAPHSATVAHEGQKKFDGVDYINPDGVGGLVADTQNDAQIDRSGIMPSIDALIRGAARGVTSNYADEISAGLNSIIPMGQSDGTVWTKGLDAFGDNLALQHQIDAADDAQHPIMSGIGKGAGAALQMLLGGKALGAAAPELQAGLGAAGAARPVATALTLGPAAGAAAGALAGSGEGTTMEERTKNANMGAFTGGATGLALGGATSLAPAVARYAGVLFGRAPEREAMRQLVQALQRDGFDVTSPSGVQALRTELGSYLGKPVSLADIGNATRARAGVGLRAPSDAQSQAIDQVLARQAGQGQRLSSDITRNVAPRTDVHALDEALIAQRDTAALPLRDQALFEGGPGYGNPARSTEPLAIPNGVADEGLDAGLRRAIGASDTSALPTYQPTAPAQPPATVTQARIPADPTLQGLARLPFAQRALGQARKLAQEEVNLRSVLGQDISHLPDVTKPGADLDMRTLDYLKRFLDNEVNTLARRADTNTFKAAEFAQVRDLRNALRDRMRTAVPEYGQYLDTYRGSSEMIDALGAGRDFSKLDPEQIAAMQAERSTAGQELYRVGVARDLTDAVRSTTDGNNPVMRILNSPESRDQLAATGVTSENMADLTRSVAIERQLARLPAELAGSQTAQRAAATADAEAGAAGNIPFNPGSPLGWAGALGRAVLNRTSTARNASVNEALLPRLLETDPAAMSRTIDDLERQGQYAQAAALRRNWITALTAGTLGNRVGTESSMTGGN